jgi:ATP-binding cassette subfamily F protein 3
MSGPPEKTREERKRDDAERKKKQRAAESLQRRISDLEGRIAEKETQVKELEAQMAAPGFYDDRDAAKAAADKHQALMWEVGDLMSQWEALQEHAAEPASES